MAPRALVLMTGRDCERYAARALASVAAQTHPDVTVLVVDDASGDGTADAVRAALAEHLPGRGELVVNPERWGKARSAWTHLRRPDLPGDFVAVLDLDDELVEADVLARMAAAYEQGFDVVWTNFDTDLGNLGRNRPLDALRSPRAQGWATSHLFSFRRCLLDAVPASHLQDDDGRWLTSACDQAIALPVLDQTRRYLFLPTRAYRYTQTNPASHHNRDTDVAGITSRHQMASSAVVAGKAPLPCTRGVADVPAVLRSALSTHGELAPARAELAPAARAQLARTTARLTAALELHDREGLPWEWLGEPVAGAAEVLVALGPLLDAHAAPRVLAFGTGPAAGRVLAAMCRSRGGSLTVVEDDAWAGVGTADALRRSGLAGTARTVLTPLVEASAFDLPARFYAMDWLAEDAVYDVVVVAGPDAAASDLARLPALPAVAAHLSTEGFDVLLADHDRSAERTVGEVWRAVAPDLHYSALGTGESVLHVCGRPGGAP